LEHNDLVLTIKHIRPSAQFALRGDKLDWLDTEQDEPTEAEIQAGWTAYEAKLKADKASELAKKAAAEAKLVALGLTVEDLKALGLG
jgi:hypothetical protein